MTEPVTEPVTVVLDREKATKNTVRYAERNGDEPTRIGTLYLQKATVAALGDPQAITITVDAAR